MGKGAQGGEVGVSDDVARPEQPYPTIVKSARDQRLRPNLVDYDEIYRQFSWDSARLMLEGLPDGRGLNIAHEAVDRHAAGPLAARVMAFASARPADGGSGATYVLLRRQRTG